MDPSDLLLAQALTLSGLIGAAGAYAGIVRRRVEYRIAVQASANASAAALERVHRTMALARIDQTFVKSSIRRRDRDSTPRWL